jgi:hypothetical protein
MAILRALSAMVFGEPTYSWATSVRAASAALNYSNSETNLAVVLIAV